MFSFFSVITLPKLTNFASIPRLVEAIFTYLVGFAGTIAVIAIIISGIKYLAATSEDAAQSAKASLITSIIGVIIIASSYAIISIIVNFFFD